MINKLKVFWFSVILILNSLGCYLLGFYQNGDQKYYRLLYSELEMANFFDIFFLAFNLIGSSEPLSIIILWIGAQIAFPKDLYISLYNFLLLFGILLYCGKRKAGWIVIVLILSNYYIWVMLMSAERLKFAFIIITYSFIFYEKIVIKKILLLLSIGAHFQSAIFLLGLITYKGNFLIFVKKKENWLLILPVTILLIYIIKFYFIDNLIHKFNVYSRSGEIYDLINPSLLFLVSIFSLNSRLVALKIFMIFVPLFYTFGGDRLTMIYFMLLFYTLGLENNLNKPLFIALLFYYSLKTIFFISNIYMFGTGFV
jgi:hypothetical protein